MKTTQSSEELTKRQQNNSVFWSVFGNRRRYDWIRRRTNGAHASLWALGQTASFWLNTDLPFGARAGRIQERERAFIVSLLFPSQKQQLFGVVLNKFPPAGAQVPLLDLPRRPCWGRRGRSWTWRLCSPWWAMSGGEPRRLTAWPKDGRTEGWKYGWVGGGGRDSLCVGLSLWRRRAAVRSYSCLGHKFSEPDWLFGAVMITWSHACGRRWGLEGVSDGAGPSVQLPPRHPMSLTWSLRLGNLQVRILSRWSHGR